MYNPPRNEIEGNILSAGTAGDRPYKKGKNLSEAVKILDHMVKDRHIDGDLRRLFLESGISRSYAPQELSPEKDGQQGMDLP